MKSWKLTGSALCTLLLLSACETPPSQQETFDEEGTTAVGNAQAGRDVRSGQMQAEQQLSPRADFVQNVGDRVFFATDSSVVPPAGQETLRRQAEWLRNYPTIDVVIEGHADERGTREYNLALGERRANAAKEILVAAGVSPDRISTISYGKERPAVLGSNPEAWAKNRRAVTVLVR